MDWHIISIGDEAYLFKIFQFLSMLNSPGTSLYAKLGLLGAMLGLMLLLFQVVSSSGRQFNLGSLLIGAVMFMVFFGSSTDVTLEDFHTGRTDIVSGVPLGTAFVGHVVSQSGVALIELFQQGTTVPGHEVMHEDYALEALAAMRGLTTGDLCDGNATLCPFTHTLVAYIHDCVLPTYNGLGRNGQTGWWAGDPSTADNALEAMAVSNEFLVTTDSIHDSNNSPMSQDCKTTYADLTKASATTRVTDAMASQALAAAHQAVPVGSPPGTATSQAQEMLGNSYNAIAADINNAQGAAAATLLNAVSADAMHISMERGRLTTSADVGNAAMIASGAMARDVRYAAEQSMFGRTLNATMAFFEGVIYGMAPFVAFLIPLGAVGIKFLARYLQLLLWLFLWLPLMSFVNLYEIMAVTREMNALLPARAGGSLYSMVGIMEVQNSAADWVALGGWFTTSVIGLSGMVVFGSVAAFQSIASAAHGPDAVDPSGLAPTVMDSAPLVHTGSMFASSGGTALMRSGASDFNVSLGGGLSYTENLKHQGLVNALVGAGMSRSEAVRATWQDAVTWANGVSTTHGKTGSVGQQDSVGRDTRLNAADTIGQSVGGTVKEFFGGDAALGAKALGTGGGIKAGGVMDGSQAHSQSSTVALGTGKAVTEGEQASVGVSDGTNHSISNTDSNGLIYNRTHDQSWNRNLSKTISDLRSYDETMSQSSSLESKGTVTGAQIGSSLPNNQEAYDGVMNAVTHLGGGQHFEDLASQLQSTNFADPRQARAVAAMATLEYLSTTGGEHGSPAVRLEATHALLAGMEAVNPALPGELGSSAMSILGTDAAIHKSQVLGSSGGVGNSVDAAMAGHEGQLGHNVAVPGQHGPGFGLSPQQQALYESGSQAADATGSTLHDKEYASKVEMGREATDAGRNNTIPDMTTSPGYMPSLGGIYVPPHEPVTGHAQGGKPGAGPGSPNGTPDATPGNPGGSPPMNVEIVGGVKTSNWDQSVPPPARP
ncbi:conjugal transfer protein TraG N-terminal domain-containing protein [Rhodanobacter sp. FW106-PBR-R2A-1-13]|uniref:conjugal transfer protein TraG N-terminal domain-containing protein n=1 Tax=Rhodanobacter sp. FW106-PBR-R2A-1-13 TaxID=3454845 RepID=UPI0034E4AC9F